MTRMRPTPSRSASVPIGPLAARVGLALSVLTGSLALAAVMAVSTVRGEVAPANAALVEFVTAPVATLKLPDLAGKEHDLAAYRGQLVVVNFWATWCAPCLAEMPAFERAQRAHWPSGVRLLAVNTGDPDDSVRRFVERTGVTFPVLLDRWSAVTRAWQVTALPVTYVIGPDGHVKAGALGVRDWDHPDIAAAFTRWQKNGS